LLDYNGGEIMATKTKRKHYTQIVWHKFLSQEAAALIAAGWEVIATTKNGMVGLAR